MKYNIVFIILFTTMLQLSANDSIARVNILEQMPGVEVIQDSTIMLMLHGTIYGHGELVEIDGYRLQVYSSNQQQTAKDEALNLDEELKDKISHSIYTTYMPPFWKVRIGDFRTYEEARDYKKEFVLLYPDLIGETYIVRDKIKVLQ